MWSQPYPFSPLSPLERDRHRPGGSKIGSFPRTAQLACPDETLLIRLLAFQASIQLNGFPSMHLPRMSLATNRTSLLSVSGSAQGQNLVATLNRASAVSVASNNPFEFEDDSEDEEK